MLPIKNIEMPTFEQDQPDVVQKNWNAQHTKMQDRESQFYKHRDQTSNMVEACKEEWAKADQRLWNIKRMLGYLVGENAQQRLFGFGSTTGSLNPRVVRRNVTVEQSCERLLEQWAKEPDYDGPVGYEHVKAVLDHFDQKEIHPDENMIMAPDGTTIKDLTDAEPESLNQRLSKDNVLACCVLGWLYSYQTQIRQSRHDLNDDLSEWYRESLWSPAHNEVEGKLRLFQFHYNHLNSDYFKREWHENLTSEDIEAYCDAFEQAHEQGVEGVDEGALLYAVLASK